MKTIYYSYFRKKNIIDRNMGILVLLITIAFLLSVIRYIINPNLDDYKGYAEVIRNLIKNPNRSNFSALSKIDPSIRNRPVFPFFIAILTLITPISINMSSFIISALSVIISIIYIFRICKTLDYSRDQSFKVLFLFISSSVVTVNFVRPITDNVSLLLSLMSVFYYSEYLERKQLRSLVYTYILAILAVLTREIFLFLFLAYLIFPSKKFSGFKRTLSFFILPFLFFVIANFIFPFFHLLDFFSQAALHWTPGEPFLQSFREFLYEKLVKWLSLYTWAKLLESLTYSILIPIILARKDLISHLKTNIFVFWGLIYSIFLLFLNSPVFVGRLWLSVTYIPLLWIPNHSKSPENKTSEQITNNKIIIVLILIGFAITIIRLIFLKYDLWTTLREYSY